MITGRAQRERLRRAARRRRLAEEMAVITDVDRSMMDRALELAVIAAQAGEVPVGAVVYRDDAIVAEAMNERESETDPTAHAELVAIRRAGLALGTWRLTGCTLAVTLEPCPMCAGAAVNARLDRLIYGALDPKAGACRSLYRIPEDQRLNHCVVVAGGIRADAAATLLSQFFQARRTDSGPPS